jgi:hypothetical protein
METRTDYDGGCDRLLVLTSSDPILEGHEPGVGPQLSTRPPPTVAFC